MKTRNHEVIFAIVDADHSEDAMEIAREKGVRGGTIISGRGIMQENETAFFGISIHAEKEILMMVVEKEIRDEVLHALYKRPGAQSNSQDIIFSLPVTDVAGLIPLPGAEK